VLTLLLLLSIADDGVHPILAIPIGDDFVRHPAIRGFFADVLAQGGYGNWKTERAAFVVREENGDYRCFSWPAGGTVHRQEFKGTIPDRTVAIVHTHPKELPLASRDDVRTAQRLHVPIFVLTPRNIDLITPRGESVAVVSDQMWSGERRRCAALPRTSARSRFSRRHR
jgi:proteasome lid subunit RPN8/RPN11